jgi:two-component system sensor histidine kinase KdpD
LLATIQGSAERLANLIANLLDLSRLQAGALHLDSQPVSVDEVVARALLDRHLHQVVNDNADDLPLVVADPGLLERVVANIADNGHRHAPPGSTVEVRAHATHDTVEVAVVDHGPGVKGADWESIFLPFQRLDDRCTTGVGHGLAIARGFTAAMNGTLRPAHTPGGGLTVTISLPRAAPVHGGGTPG